MLFLPLGITMPLMLFPGILMLVRCASFFESSLLLPFCGSHPSSVLVVQPCPCPFVRGMLTMTRFSFPRFQRTGYTHSTIGIRSFSACFLPSCSPRPSQAYGSIHSQGEHVSSLLGRRPPYFAANAVYGLRTHLQPRRFRLTTTNSTVRFENFASYINYNPLICNRSHEQFAFISRRKGCASSLLPHGASALMVSIIQRSGVNRICVHGARL